MPTSSKKDERVERPTSAKKSVRGPGHKTPKGAPDKSIARLEFFTDHEGTDGNLWLVYQTESGNKVWRKWRTRNEKCIVCEKYLDTDVKKIPHDDFIKIVRFVGRPWRFIDNWGRPWKIVRNDDPFYPYKWLKR